MSDSIYSHILLCENLCFAEGKTRPTKITEKSKFLSSLALLLNGNASCTAVYVHGQDKVVYIARNEPITTNDKRYFDRFFRGIRIYANLCFGKDKNKTTDDAHQQLISLVFEYNSKKIINRFVGRRPKIIDHLKTLVQLNTNEKSHFVEELRSNAKVYKDRPLITEKICFISKRRTEEDYVDHLLKTLDRFLLARNELIENQANPTDQQLALAIGLAVILYQSRLFRYMLRSLYGANVDGIYYFEKISAHGRSMGLLLKCLLHRESDLGEIYKNISWKLVPHIQRTQSLTVVPKQAFEVIFKDLCNSSNQTSVNVGENITCETFYNDYLNRMSSVDERATHLVHVHAEILLIDHILKNNINETNGSGDVEIGISKMCCFLCSYYIEQLNKKYDRCFCIPNSSNGKIYSKWSLRTSEDPSIIQLINAKLIEKIKQSIQKLSLESERTGPKRNGDCDVMFTSIEHDEFDNKKYLDANF